MQEAGDDGLDWLDGECVEKKKKIDLREHELCAQDIIHRHQHQIKSTDTYIKIP